MKKIFIAFLCVLMLGGCQNKDYTQFYNDTYDLLKNQGITMGLGTSSGKVVFYGTTEDVNFKWMCVLDDNLDTESIMTFPDGQYVYGDEVIENEEYNAFLKQTKLTQEDLNLFSKVFYENNITKAKDGI